ncbi:ParA family protein [Rhodococcus erythropolis]
MKRIAFFNNKGGVGKTTLACNIAHYLSAVEGKRVLLVDLDPQCNATQLILDSSDSVNLYWRDDEFGTPMPLGDTAQGTIYEAAQPLEEGEGTSPIPEPMSKSNNRFEIDLVPGHPRMSMFEDRLGPWFREATGGMIEGLRRTVWLDEVLDAYSDRYDVTLFDMGPSLGALNRSILAVSDHFITPMGADIFSVIALRNIAEWIGGWSKSYRQGVKLCEDNNPGVIRRLDIPSELRITSGFAGYTVQQYSTVSVRGERRATVAYDKIINQIPNQIEKFMGSLAVPGLDTSELSLGDVPNLRSLIPLAQSANAPLSALTSKDGLAGGQYSQQRNYAQLINVVGKRLSENCLS